jgi:hypothetical protein
VVVEQSKNPGEQLFQRELVRNDNAGVFPALRSPIPRKPVEVRDVVCQERSMFLSGEGELVGIGGRDAASVLRCEDIMAARYQNASQEWIHVLVQVETGGRHGMAGAVGRTTSSRLAEISASISARLS